MTTPWAVASLVVSFYVGLFLGLKAMMFANDMLRRENQFLREQVTTLESDLRAEREN